jgi:hypothetical protein
MDTVEIPEEEEFDLRTYYNTHKGTVLLVCAPLICSCVAGPLLFVGFGIYFLYSDVDVCTPYSPLWVHCCTVLILYAIHALFRRSSKSEIMPDNVEQSRAQAVREMQNNWVTVVLNLICTVYGGAVIYGDVVCSSMKDKGLWTWALVNFYLNVFGLGLYVCGLGCLCFLFKCVDNDDDRHPGIQVQTIDGEAQYIEDDIPVTAEINVTPIADATIANADVTHVHTTTFHEYNVLNTERQQEAFMVEPYEDITNV